MPSFIFFNNSKLQKQIQIEEETFVLHSRSFALPLRSYDGLMSEGCGKSKRGEEAEEKVNEELRLVENGIFLGQPVSEKLKPNILLSLFQV